MKIEAILFDVIGTTVKEKDPNTVNNCLLHAFTDHEVMMDVETLKQYRGHDKKEIISTLVNSRQLPESSTEKILQSFHQRITNNIHNFFASEGAEELFAYLRTRNIRIGLGTGLSRDLFEKIMMQIEWKQSDFDYIGISSELLHGRPHPDMILDMMNKLAISNPAHFLKVGDTVADIQEGKNAGVVTAVILSGTQPQEHLEKEKPDFMLKALHEVKSIIE